MNTLIEIESAVSRLPLLEQEELMRHLGARIRRRRSAAGSESRQQWMNRLDALRATIGSGKVATATEQLLSDLREERN